MTYWFFHPQTRRFLLLTPHEQRYRASFFDAAGEPDWLTQIGDLDDLLSAAEASGYVKTEARPGMREESKR